MYTISPDFFDSWCILNNLRLGEVPSAVMIILSPSDHTPLYSWLLPTQLERQNHLLHCRKLSKNKFKISKEPSYHETEHVHGYWIFIDDGLLSISALFLNLFRVSFISQKWTNPTSLQECLLKTRSSLTFIMSNTSVKYSSLTIHLLLAVDRGWNPITQWV